MSQRKAFDVMRSNVFSSTTSPEERAQLHDEWICRTLSRLQIEEVQHFLALLSRKTTKGGVFRTAQLLADQVEDINPLIFAEGISKFHERRTYLQDTLNQLINRMSTPVE